MVPFISARCTSWDSYIERDRDTPVVEVDPDLKQNVPMDSQSIVFKLLSDNIIIAKIISKIAGKNNVNFKNDEKKMIN